MAALLRASPRALAETWLVFLGTGLRAGELAALEWRDVDLEAGTLRVRAETSKSRRTRTVPLRRDVAAVLGRLRLRVAERPATDEARRLVFVNSRGTGWRRNLSRKLKTCLRAAGLPASVDLHCLRHTFASHAMAAARGDVATVQMLLGHSSPRVTLEVYVHALEGRGRAVVEAVPLPDVGEAGFRAAPVRPKAMGD